MTPNADLDFESVRKIVGEHFPCLWPAVEAGLSTCATLLLVDNANPVALIYVGPPSVGKTTVVSMFDGSPLCYRSDKFTPASFVTQSANATEAKLAKIDLLPRIKHKVLLTPELSTIFRGKQDELADRFSIITRVMDGQGLMIDSGTHGRRGYEGDYFFAWLGATTPFEPIVWKVMAQLGSRLFFLMLDAVADPSVDDLVLALQQPVPYQDGLVKCREAVHRYLADLFKQHHGIRGVRWSNEQTSADIVTSISRCATLLAAMRTPYEQGKAAQLESPHRANAVLHNLARGHALVSGRTCLAKDDLPILAGITLSSIPIERKAVLLAFAKNAGQPLTVKEVDEVTGLSRHAAEGVMAEMEWLGAATFEKEGIGKPSHLNLKPDWAWIAQDGFAALLLEGATWQESRVECRAATS